MDAVHQANQRKAIMESLMAAQRYCLLTTCRRKFLLQHFGESFSADKCGSFLLKFISFSLLVCLLIITVSMHLSKLVNHIVPLVILKSYFSRNASNLAKPKNSKKIAYLKV